MTDEAVTEEKAEAERGEAGRRGRKSPGAYRTISEVADELQVPQHVLRFWETKFPQIRPLKRAGGRRSLWAWKELDGSATWIARSQRRQEFYDLALESLAACATVRL